MYELKLNSTYCISLVSAVLVCFMCNLFIKNDINFEYLALELTDIRNLVLQDKQIVLGTVGLNRIKQLIVLLIIMKAFGSKNTYNFLMILLGSILGFVLSIQVYYVGMGGIIIFMVYIFPHYLIYLLAMYYSSITNMFERGNDSNIKKVMSFALIYVVGIVVECVFMTFFLKIFYQYMVS